MLPSSRASRSRSKSRSSAMARRSGRPRRGRGRRSWRSCLWRTRRRRPRRTGASAPRGSFRARRAQSSSGRNQQDRRPRGGKRTRTHTTTPSAPCATGGSARARPAWSPATAAASDGSTRAARRWTRTRWRQASRGAATRALPKSVRATCASPPLTPLRLSRAGCHPASAPTIRDVSTSSSNNTSPTTQRRLTLRRASLGSSRPARAISARRAAARR
mmetsp:Transcript_4027/g.9627  ORF Transcript_4027/g.9627 Transcript_4027/m.9627 type:complete len:217 (+) Transcript_4027:443-1093(+)